MAGLHLREMTVCVVLHWLIETKVSTPFLTNCQIIREKRGKDFSMEWDITGSMVVWVE